MPDRRTYLGSGDIAAVAGVSPYEGDTALDVWAKKTGAMPDTISTDAMRIGEVLEQPIINELYAPPRNLITRRVGWVQHPTIPYFGATVDSMATGRDGLERNVECKVVGGPMQKHWDLGADDVDAVPPNVLVQVQWQMLCTGRLLTDIVALLGTNLRVFTVERDDRMIEQLTVIGESFWGRVERLEAPVITAENADSARALLEHMYPRQLRGLDEATPAESALIEEYISAREAEKAATNEKQRVAALLQQTIAEREGIIGDGLKATWKASDNGLTAWKELALSLGPTDDQIAQYTKQASRRLDVRRVKSRRK